MTEKCGIENILEKALVPKAVPSNEMSSASHCRVGKLAEVVIVSRGAAEPMGRFMSFVDIPTRREFFEEEQTLAGHTKSA